MADVVLRAPRRMSDGSPHDARPVYFVHVGKTGGTSVDDLMTRILKCESRAYVDNAHYDWSFVRHRERLRRRTYAIGEADDDELRKDLGAHVRKEIGPLATPDKIQFAPGLPKTRSGKIMRRILRKIAEDDFAALGDTSTLADPAVVDDLIEQRQNKRG